MADFQVGDWDDSRIHVQGAYFHAIDDKGRIIVPHELRAGLGKEIYMTISSRDTLLLFPPAEWKRQLQRIWEEARKQPQTIGPVLQRVTAYSRQAKSDNNWRVLIPQDLREKVGLDRGMEVVSIGDFDRVELVSRVYFEAVLKPQIDSQQTKAQQALLGL